MGDLESGDRKRFSNGFKEQVNDHESVIRRLPGEILNRQHPGADACRQRQLMILKKAVRRHGDRRKRCRQDDFDWKLASKLKKQGRKVLIAAADTFRAAAGDQLEEWANRAGVDMIGGGVEGL